MAQQLLFCNAKDRPKYCKLRTNMCCALCYNRIDCLSEAEVMKQSKPCDPEENTKDEPCPFAV